MEDVIEFFTGLFSTALWPPRWRCGYWSDFHGWLYIASDVMIWFSYFAIPTIILSYAYKKKFELKYSNTYFLFASFILLCGSTHLLDAVMFWSPMYRLNGLVRLLTGIVSLFTVYHLIRILPTAFREKTSLALEGEIKKRMEAERKLEQMNEGLQAFAYMVSHDLQEPLRKIRYFTSEIARKHEPVFDEQSKLWTQKTVNAANRMEEMIQAILNLTTIHERVDFQTVDLNAVVRQAAGTLEVKVNASQAQIHIDTLPVITGNEIYLTQLFTNLISNSIKFSKRRPVIYIKEGNSSGAFTEIVVQDNGIGMPQEDVERMFQPFQRLHPKNAYEGSGIGLAICKRIVEVHGGYMKATSVEDEGTTFMIGLPR